MSRVPKKISPPAEPVVYCGPAVPGKAAPFTTYSHGLPSPLMEAAEANPVLGALIVPLSQLPEVRRQLQNKAGRYYTLYCKAQEMRERRN